MQPLTELLHRIRWDAEFGQGEFALGYYDRVERHERVVPFLSISIDADRGSFTLRDEGGMVVRVPLHRVRTVYKNGSVIWHRPARPAAD